MFLRASTSTATAASSGCTSLRCVMKTSEYRKSIDSFLQRAIKTIHQSLMKAVQTAHLSTGQGTAQEYNKEERIDDDSKMPLKKQIKLANKLKNLPRSYAATAIADGNLPRLSDGEVEADVTDSNEGSSVETLSKSKLRLNNLKREKSSAKEDGQEGRLMPQSAPKKRGLKAVVDIEMMKSELKQLEDPPITQEDKILSCKRLGFDFFDVPSVALAKNLLGKILVRKLEDGTLLRGKIVETESYLGGEDRASQTYGNKVTPRNMPMYMPPGTIYVYLTYGMYHCFNVSCRGTGAVVLLRALSPIQGMERMGILRNSKPTPNSKARSPRRFKDHELSSGPSKFCMAFGLNRDHNKHSICTWKELWVEDNAKNEDIEIVECPRIGIDSAGPEWAMKPLRFYVLGDKSVSKIDKRAEAGMKNARRQ